MKIFCTKCNTELTITFNPFSSDKSVAPCPDCLENEREKGHWEGHDHGSEYRSPKD